jgi:flagellar protein FlaG
LVKEGVHVSSNQIPVNSTASEYSVSASHASSPPTKSLSGTTESSTTESLDYAQIIHKAKYKRTVADEAIVDAVEKANKAIIGEPKRFEYSVHKGFGDIVIKIINTETNEVIKEIPPEKLLDIVENLAKISGAIIDERR